MLAATMPTKPAAIHSMVSIKRSIEARFIRAPDGSIWARQPLAGDPPPFEYREDRYCVSALYLTSEARSSDIAASGSTPVFLTPSAQVLISGSEAFFHKAVCSGVSL